MSRLHPIALGFAGLVLGSGPQGSLMAGGPPATPAPPQLKAGLSPHFLRWLDAHGYGPQRFERGDLQGGSFGGRQDDQDPVQQRPVIFIHGNSDRAIGAGSAYYTGWNASIAFFLSRGYRSSELYATTWGPADSSQAPLQAHTRAYLERLRAFIQAVKDYTGAPKVSVVAHSMGVTLARKAILGGKGKDPRNGPYDLGPPLTPIIDTFVGIAGANWGLQSCAGVPDLVPACSTLNGFFPGSGAGGEGLSAFLAELNASSHFEGAKVYSIWSTADEVIGPDNLVWGRPTSPIPGQDGEKAFTSAPYGHIGLKDLTARHQWRMVTFHETD